MIKCANDGNSYDDGTYYDNNNDGNRSDNDNANYIPIMIMIIVITKIYNNYVYNDIYHMSVTVDNHIALSYQK